jgi:hypothetical protein
MPPQHSHHHHGPLRHALRHDAGWAVAASHVLCALVGGGVLSLPHAVSWTGVIPGAICLVIFLGVGICSALLLVSARTTPRDGVRHATYYGAARAALGARAAAAVAVFQNTNNVLSATGYTIAAGQSARMVARSLGASPEPGFSAKMSALFALVQVGMSQLPSLEEAWWSSALGALMSLLYAASAVLLSGLTLVMGSSSSSSSSSSSTAGSSSMAAADDPHIDADDGNGWRRALLVGRRAPTGALKAFGVFNALGALMFAFNFSSVQIEIHDTLHEPPDSDRAMRKATVSALACAFSLYAAVAFSGAAALGEAAPGNVLTGFARPRWLVAAANVFVLVHMFGAFQLFSQPVFLVAEGALLSRWPRLAAGGGAAGMAAAGAEAAADGQQQQQQQGQRRQRKRGRRRRHGRDADEDDARGTASLMRSANGRGDSSSGHHHHHPLAQPPRVLAGGGIYRPGNDGGGDPGEIELGGAESWTAQAPGARPAPLFRLHSDELEDEEAGGDRRGGGGGGAKPAATAAAAAAAAATAAALPPAAASDGNGGGSNNNNTTNDNDDAASLSSRSSSDLSSSSPAELGHDRPPRASLPLRLALRTLYVCLVAAAAVTFEESFEGVVGLGGAVVYWPQAVYVPTSIFLATRSPGPTARRALLALNAAVGVVALLATLGAVHSLMSGMMTPVRGMAPGALVDGGAGGQGGSWPADEVVYGPPLAAEEG